MSDTIKPALTAAEWLAPQIQRTDRHGNVLVIVRETGIGEEEIPEGGSEAMPAEQAGGRAHAVAAIALHGKSFGFTQKHADNLGAIRADYAAVLSTASGLHKVKSAEILAELDAVIARIEALLPPR